MAKNIRGYSLLTVVIVAVVVSLIVSVATTTISGKVITGNTIGNYANELWGKVLRISGDGKGQFAAGSTSTYSTITSISDKSNTNSARTPLNIDASEVNVKGNLNVGGLGIYPNYIFKASNFIEEYSINKTNIFVWKNGIWVEVKSRASPGTVVSYENIEFQIVYINKDDKKVVLKPLHSDWLLLGNGTIAFDSDNNDFFIGGISKKS